MKIYQEFEDDVVEVVTAEEFGSSLPSGKELPLTMYDVPRP